MTAVWFSVGRAQVGLCQCTGTGSRDLFQCLRLCLGFAHPLQDVALNVSDVTEIKHRIWQICQ